ncbi:hypothetical protein FSP39_022625 [Pinctada imbricata]|uniref:Receptor for retinol uptake STRA6 n=1 Tax=Pinctada imbricata TaxID=66713 RepID=A0AA89BZ93_PINIB|nr:hypothetical protein FSP39_022625 [Pinctada imbricata]
MIDKGINYVDYLTILRGYEQEATELLNAAKYSVFCVRVILLITLPLTFVIGVVMIVQSLANYRYLLRKLYARNYCHLTPKDEIGNSSALVGSMRYAGYQVGYIVWGFLIQFLLLTLVASILTAVIQLWSFLDTWIIDKIHALWPVLLTSFVVNIIQLLLAKFFFLQERGEQLAIENRRLFFIMTYFMFFYNIFIGLVSCLLRILKSMILGSLFIPRLDHSVLPRKFQRFDPGFHAFCGFMHVESAHTHSVIMVFISILQAESFNTLKANSEKPSLKSMMGKGIATVNGTYDMVQSKRSRKARWKWLLAYTLIQNPTLCLERKIALAKQKNESIIMTVLQDNYEATPAEEKIDIQI